MKCHILFTIRNEELAPYSYLVFRTIRIGFPTATIKVWFNGREETITDREGFEFEKIERTTHHGWIKKLCMEEKDPFFICDTDLVFFDSVEGYESDRGLFGWRIPEWNDEFTRTVTRSRLHTSLLRINPKQLNAEIAEYKSKINTIDFINPHASMFAPMCVALHGVTYFYDVCSMLYHAVGGAEFPDEVKEKYCHLNFGTISDLVLPKLNNGEKMKEARGLVLNNPDLGRGAWRVQEHYYANHQFSYEGQQIVDNMSQDDIRLAQQWNMDLCCGDRDAMVFCDLYHSYVHLIDDIVDSMRDGRPVMSKSQIISTFFKAAVLYNCAFYVANRSLLFPIILQVTNMYQDSVAWERSPHAHLRKIADVLRTCGGELYFIIALICGGESHMRRMSQLIRDRDYTLQHDSNDQPI